jgi:hypothetical protein
MTRAATGDTVVVRPTNNVYTVLVIAATIVAAAALGIVIYAARQQGISIF